MSIQFINQEARALYSDVLNELAGLQRERFIEAVKRISDQKKNPVGASDILAVVQNEGLTKAGKIIIKKNNNGKE